MSSHGFLCVSFLWFLVRIDLPSLTTNHHFRCNYFNGQCHAILLHHINIIMESTRTKAVSPSNKRPQAKRISREDKGRGSYWREKTVLYGISEQSFVNMLSSSPCRWQNHISSRVSSSMIVHWSWTWKERRTENNNTTSAIIIIIINVRTQRNIVHQLRGAGATTRRQQAGRQACKQWISSQDILSE